YRVASRDAVALLLTGRAPVHVEPSYRASQVPIIYEPEKGLPFACCLYAVTEGGRVSVGGGGITFYGASAVTLLITARTGFAGPKLKRSPAEVATMAYDDARKAAARPYDELRSEHVADHRSLFDRVQLELGTTDSTLLPTDERI